MKLVVAHSPDPDDAFMFFALAEGKIPTGPYHFEHVLADIETLNRAALAGQYHITAISAYAYAFAAERYLILDCGASVGDNYGPIIVARDELPAADLAARWIAVPGTLTTAFLTLRVWLRGEPKCVSVPFDRILEAVKAGRWDEQPVDAGVVIHEGQLNYADWGLHCVLDLGQWWKTETGLPLPLGINVIRRDLPAQIQRDACELIRQSILYARKHPDEALKYAARFGRGLEYNRLRKFVEMYVNEATVRMPPEVVAGIELLLKKAKDRGLVERDVKPEFAPAG